MLPDFFINLKMEKSMPSRYHFTWNIIKYGTSHTLKYVHPSVNFKL